MRMIRGVVFVLSGLFIMVTLISLLIPSAIVVTRAEAMRGDSLKIYNEISDLRNWKHWHPVFKNDSAGIFLSNVTNEVNSSATWFTSGKRNTLLITQKQFPFVTIELQREGEKEIINRLSLLSVQEKGNNQVQWESLTKLKWYPWDKFGGIFIEKMTGPGYEMALKSLKEYVESD
ncbi:MAG: hypothetical protein WKF88_05125 [Ferruginibacter sp.]